MTAPKKWTRQKRRELIADVFEARRDLSGLAEAHRLSPADLAAWVGEPEVQRCLTGLCLLADLQTQLMLSRYRQVAVGELIKQASGGGDDGSAVSVEQARKACVDLLKADLKRADLTATLPKHGEGGEGGEGAGDELALLREALFGNTEPAAAAPTETDPHPSPDAGRKGARDGGESAEDHPTVSGAEARR